MSAIAKQAGEMDYAPGFQLGHPLAFEAATAVAGLMPAGLDRVFFTNSGSESVDTALKIALAYHRARGEGQRTRLIGRERGYHGVGFGGISVGGISPNRKTFSGALLPAVDHLPHTHNLEKNAYSKGQPAWGAHLAEELERIIALHDASTIAAVIVEPMAGSTGVLVPPVGYLEKLREITAKHGILLIFDEVITAYGRLGEATAAHYFGVTPDLITMAKGVSNAAIPAGAVAVKREVHDAIVTARRAASSSSTATPIRRTRWPPPPSWRRWTSIDATTCSAAPASCPAPSRKPRIRSGRAARHRRAQHRPGGRHRTGAPRAGARASEVFQKCFDSGLMVRYTGDIIAVSPPLIIDEAQIGQIFDQIGKVLKEVA